MENLIEKNRRLTNASLDERSLELRRKIVQMISAAGRGHVGSAFSLIEIVRTLYDHVIKFDPANPRWPDRDRFILSKGHGCLGLYVVLAEKGFFPEEELFRLCTFDGMLGGHPEYKKMPGVEASTGSLGHGLPIGSGMALNAKLEGKAHRVFVLLGDGECNEGSVWEAAMFAAKYRLDNLTVIVDYNKQQTYDTTYNILDLEPFVDKWRSFGFWATECDGHDVSHLRNVFSEGSKVSGKPAAIICHTIKGRGPALTEYNLSWHHKNKISDAEIATLIDQLGGK